MLTFDMVLFVLVEAEPLQIALHSGTVIVFIAIAPARRQGAGFLLLLEDF